MVYYRFLLRVFVFEKSLLQDSLLRVFVLSQGFLLDSLLIHSVFPFPKGLPKQVLYQGSGDIGGVGGVGGAGGVVGEGGAGGLGVVRGPVEKLHLREKVTSKTKKRYN